jgi:fructokinase
MKGEKPLPLLLGGIEGGGTKFVCAVGTPKGEVLAEVRFPTTSPGETLDRIISFLKEQINILGPLASIGVASFGPLDPRPSSEKFGHILPTPKPGWTNADLVGPLRVAFDVPVSFDTDVNGAALGEWRWGAARGLETFIYLTIGTGIGGGGLVNGELMHGLLHPEMGHIPLPHDRGADPFEGACPFHGDCLEGLASGLAMGQRWGVAAESLPPDHPAWELEAGYIALALRTFICTLSPERIILGGGVMEQTHLLPLVRKKTLATLNGYIQAPQILQRIDTFIVSPELAGRAGILGALVLAERALETASTV